MNELQAAASALTSLKAAFDLSKAFLDVKGAVEVQGKVFELQRVILAAQQDALTANEAQAMLLKRIGELKTTIANLETWGREKEKYELTQVRSGVFAYRLKPEAQGTRPDHYLCATCFEHRQKSVLQTEHIAVGRIQMLVCNECSAEIVIQGVRAQAPPRKLATRRR